MSKINTKCSKCNKTLLSQEKGSITAWLFRQAECTCEIAELELPSNKTTSNQPLSRETVTTKVHRSDKTQASCPHCQKVITPEEKKGTFTTYLFRNNRCQCPLSKDTSKNTVTVAADQKTPKEVIKSGTLKEVCKPDLGDRYEPIELIGQGGMGYVWKVKDLALDKALAVKLLRTELCHDQAAIKRFEQEAVAATSLTQINLCPIYGYSKTPNDTPFMIMDYLEGGDLAEYLKTEKCLASNLTLDIAIQTCEALKHAHSKGIIHRDLKPSNIILTKDPTGSFIVKVVDFGIAKLLPSINEQTNNLTQTGDLFGSPLYMSPEQCKGEPVDGRSDIYSLGCVLYEMITGNPPFLASNPIRIILKHLEEEPKPLPHSSSNSKQIAFFYQIVGHCLEKNPKDRYQSVDLLLKDLRSVKGNSVRLKSADALWHRKRLLCFNKQKKLIVFSLLTLTSMSVATILLTIAPDLIKLAPILTNLIKQSKSPWTEELLNARELSSVDANRAAIHYRKAVKIAETAGATSQEIANIKFEFGVNMMWTAPHEAYQLISYTASNEEPDNPRHALTLEYLAMLENYEAKKMELDSQSLRHQGGNLKSIDRLETEASKLKEFALEHAEQVIKLKIKGLSNKNHSFVYSAYRTKGQILFEQGRFPEAEIAFGEALAIAKNINLGEGLEEGEILYRLARCFRNEKKAQLSAKYYQQSIKKLTHILGADNQRTQTVSDEYKEYFP